VDRSAWRPWIAPTLVVALAGVLLVALGGDKLATVGAGLLGVAAVLVLSAFFYSVGRAEDRDRERRPRG
jgi:drug/metabolite transporter (DMT)-like permease